MVVAATWWEGWDFFEDVVRVGRPCPLERKDQRIFFGLQAALPASQGPLLRRARRARGRHA
jgi:hypothetical protein